VSVEERMRAVWRSSAGPEGDGWMEIERKIEAAEAQRRRRRWMAGGGALAAAALLVVAGIGILGDDDGQEVDAGPVADESTTSTTETTTTTEAPDDVDDEPATGPSPYVWEGAASGPGEAATRFLTEVVDMTSPVVLEERQGDSTSWEVLVAPRSDLRQLVTTVLVRSEGDGFGVLGSLSPNIELDSPEAGDVVGSRVALRGRARAFEGTVDVAVVEDGGREVGRGFVTGSGGPDLGPFDGRVAVGETSARAGALVLRTASAEDGSVLEATVVRVRFAACDVPDGEAGGSGRTVLVHFLCGEPDPYPVVIALPRPIGEGSGVLRAALEAQLEGPTEAEREAGIESQFAPASAGLLRGVTVSDGLAVVDLDGRIRQELSQVGTSAGGVGFLDQLDATVFQFSTVDRVEYRIDGSCDAFYEWLQSACEVRGRH
jgi:hypothetical protein